MRDRLIELLRQSERKCVEIKTCNKCDYYGRGGDCQRNLTADHLLADGVIVPPCKVGQTVYFITYNANKEIKIRRGYVGSFSIRSQNNYMVICHEGLDDEPYFENMACPFDCFGKTVFLTRDEAEKAIAERRGEG